MLAHPPVRAIFLVAALMFAASSASAGGKADPAKHVPAVPGFARFLPVAALFHAQTLNTASLARDAGVARTTVNGYLEIIEDTLLAFRLPAYEGRLRVREKRQGSSALSIASRYGSRLNCWKM